MQTDILSLNLGCGRNYKKGFVNIDLDERLNVDLRIDLTRVWPFESQAVNFIYSEHFIEHLDWFDGRKLLENCWYSLINGGTIRLVLPDFQKIFHAYVNNDREFFMPYFENLNNADFPYYSRLLTNQEEVKREETEFPRPSWHFSKSPKDIKNLKLRARFYKFHVEILDYFVHQYGEHRSVYDFDCLRELLVSIGFSKVYLTQFDPLIDSDKYISEHCLYVLAEK